ncbi:MAG TPA: type II toxin-antitoxin system VapC family toxin [Kofleriaceae bacterium]
MKVLDTDTCIAILRGNDAVIAHRAVTSDEVATTWITASELYYGAAKSKAPDKNRALVHSFLVTLPTLALDELSVQIFGEARSLLDSRGQRMADADLYIASIAVARRAAIVTANRSHYERIPGVVVESWTGA